MNYYKRHIGDYAKKAGHLSVLEHGIYTLLLDAYYDREHGPTKEEAARWARCRTQDELAALDAVLSDFFAFDGERFVQSRVEEEFRKAAEQAELNRENGKRGGRPRKQNKTEQEEKKTQPVFDGKRTESEKNPNPLIHQSTTEEPNGSLSPAKTDAIPDCPQAEIVALYHELLPTHRRMRVWDGERAKALRSRWREDPKRQSLDYWRRFFAYVAQSPFLTGQVEAKDRPPFVADLEWLVTKKNFIKVIERKYHDGGQS